MRRIARFERSIDFLRARTAVQTQSPYLCASCRCQATSFSTTTTWSARANTNVPFTEKIRQKIWGTDQPPGLEDPYGDKSVFDQTQKRTKEREVEIRSEPQSAAITDSTYEPAATWDGLQKVGGFGNWWKHNWDPDHQYKGFTPATILTDNEEVTAALHRAMVEVFALQQAGKSLQDISKDVPGEDLTHGVQISHSGTGAVLDFAGDHSLEDIVRSLSPPVDEAAKHSELSEVHAALAEDRSNVDPPQPGSVPAGIEETTKEDKVSEEGVAANQSYQEPPSISSSLLTYEDLIASWGPLWLQVSFENPEVKFAVSLK